MTMSNPNMFKNPNMLLMLQSMMTQNQGPEGMTGEEIDWSQMPQFKRDRHLGGEGGSEGDMESVYSYEVQPDGTKKKIRKKRSKSKGAKDKKKRKKKKKKKFELPPPVQIIAPAPAEPMIPDGHFLLNSDDYARELKEAEKEGEERMRRQMEEEWQRMEKDRAKKEAERLARHEKIQGLVRKFKGSIWARVLPGVFFKGMRKDTKLKRTRAMKLFTDDLPPMIDAVGMAVRQMCVKGATELWHEKKSLNILED